MVGTAFGQHGHGGHPGRKPHEGPVIVPGGLGHHIGHGGNGIAYNPSIFYGVGAFGPYAYAPPLFVIAPGGGFPPNPLVANMLPQTVPVFPNLRPAQVAQAPAAPPNRAPAAQAPRRPDPARSAELTTLGDRLFRAGNLPRAVERYEQALRADPDKAGPRVRLAQVALVRGKYTEAANKLRDAQMAEPGWLALAGDIQSVFSEPAEFARQVARLEAHLQAQPNDRDGWLVLGAEWYLSGRVRKAADVFLRLADREPDATLKAFLTATKAP